MKRSVVAIAGLLAVACAAAPPASPPKPKIKLRLGIDWVAMRAGHLGLSLDEARERDEQLLADAPPDAMFWDADIARHTAAIWRTLCEECHGGARAIEAAASIAAPQPGWGADKALLFGRERTWAEAYAMIYEGSEDRKKMPAWGKKISREQIWGLLRYIEHLSNDGVSKVTLEKS